MKEYSDNDHERVDGMNRVSAGNTIMRISFSGSSLGSLLCTFFPGRGSFLFMQQELDINPGHRLHALLREHGWDHISPDETMVVTARNLLDLNESLAASIFSDRMVNIKIARDQHLVFTTLVDLYRGNTAQKA